MMKKTKRGREGEEFFVGAKKEKKRKKERERKKQKKRQRKLPGQKR